MACTQLGILGSGIQHSLSPLIHEYWGRRYQLDLSYAIFDCAPDQLATFFATKKLHGLNVTMPFKEAVLPFVTTSDPVVSIIHAANTLCFKENQIKAYNTDYLALKWLFGGLAMNSRIVVLGTGGAAKATYQALKDLGLVNIVFVSRCPAALKNTIPWHDLDAILEQTDLLINASPLGMNGYQALEIAVEKLPASATVFDMVYHPRETVLLQKARQLNLRVISGLEMLLQQAQASFQLWFGMLPEITPELRERLA